MGLRHPEINVSPDTALQIEATGRQPDRYGHTHSLNWLRPWIRTSAQGNLCGSVYVSGSSHVI
jgi:hypothetical protein